jgi:hypothetical protein
MIYKMYYAACVQMGCWLNLSDIRQYDRLRNVSGQWICSDIFLSDTMRNKWKLIPVTWHLSWYLSHSSLLWQLTDFQVPFIYRSDCIYFAFRQKQWKVEAVFNNRSNHKIIYVQYLSQTLIIPHKHHNYLHIVRTWVEICRFFLHGNELIGNMTRSTHLIKGNYRRFPGDGINIRVYILSKY